MHQLAGFSWICCALNSCCIDLNNLNYSKGLLTLDTLIFNNLITKVPFRIMCEHTGAGHEDMCSNYWDGNKQLLEPLRHFLHAARGLFPAVGHPACACHDARHHSKFPCDQHGS